MERVSKKGQVDKGGSIPRLELRPPWRRFSLTHQVAKKFSNLPKPVLGSSYWARRQQPARTQMGKKRSATAGRSMQRVWKLSCRWVVHNWGCSVTKGHSMSMSDAQLCKMSSSPACWPRHSSQRWPSLLSWPSSDLYWENVALHSH